MNFAPTGDGTEKDYSTYLFVISMIIMLPLSGWYFGMGIDEQYQLDQKYLKVCQDFVNSGPTAISDPDEFCETYSDIMRSTK